MSVNIFAPGDHRRRVLVSMEDIYQRPRRWEEFSIEANKIEVVNFFRELRRIKVDLQDDRTLRIDVVTVVDGRDGEGPVSVTFSTGIMMSDNEPAELVLQRAIRQALKAFVEHEVDEAMHVAGVRIFDPHVHDPKY